MRRKLPIVAGIVVLAGAVSLYVAMRLVVTPKCDGLDIKTRQAWAQAADLDYSGAYRAFSQIRDCRPEDPKDAKFGQAIVLLGLQLRTRQNIAMARELFSAMHGANADHDLGIAAWYFVARIDHYHRHDTDASAAKSAYLAISERHPDHFFGQLAFMQYATMEIYENMMSPNLDSILDRLGKQGTFIEQPIIKRNFHRILAETYLYRQISDERALNHFNIALDIGFTRPWTAAKTILVHAELARDLGRYDRAERSYRSFIEQFPRHSHYNLIRARLDSSRKERAEGRLENDSLDPTTGPFNRP